MQNSLMAPISGDKLYLIFYNNSFQSMEKSTKAKGLKVMVQIYSSLEATFT